MLCKIINCIIIYFFLLLQVISHKSLRQSFQTFPCAEIIFAHDNGQNGQFRCTFELTAGDATSQICVRTSIDEVKILSCLLEWPGFFFTFLQYFSFSFTLPCKSLIGKYSTGCFFVAFFMVAACRNAVDAFFFLKRSLPTVVLLTCKALAPKLICC